MLGFVFSIMVIFLILDIKDPSGHKSRGLLLVPVGEIEQGILEGLKAPLAARFGLPVELGQGLNKPGYAYDAKRKQYLSDPILNRLKSAIPANTLAVLGVVEEDLYTPGLNFIFGQADPGGRVAVMSLCRLRNDFYGLKADQMLFEFRALKEAIHELGHVFGLSHCPDIYCVMHFSNSLSDTDLKSSEFCSRHQKELERLLGGHKLFEVTK